MFNSRKCIKPTTKIFIHSVFESHMDGIIWKINYSPFCWGPSGKGPTWKTTAVEYFFYEAPSPNIPLITQGLVLLYRAPLWCWPPLILVLLTCCLAELLQISSASVADSAGTVSCPWCWTGVLLRRAQQVGTGAGFTLWAVSLSMHYTSNKEHLLQMFFFWTAGRHVL